MYIKTIPMGPISANCHIICDEKTKVGAVIDPGDCKPILLKAIEDAGIENLKYILCTHGHFDHVFGVAKLKEKFNEAQILIGAEDAAALSDETLSLGKYFRIPIQTCSADKALKNGDIIEIGNINLEVISAPGHTPGGVLYYSKKDNVVFTGDTIFKGSVGKTTFVGGNGAQLMESLQKIKRLPEDCVILSGHGEETTVEHELKYNMFLI